MWHSIEYATIRHRRIAHGWDLGQIAKLIVLLLLYHRQQWRHGQFLVQRGALTAAERFLREALKWHGGLEGILVDEIQANREAIMSCDTINRVQSVSSPCSGLSLFPATA
jgi:hypothetical protein